MDPDNLITIRENVPLAPLTTLGVGGPARFFVKAETGEHVFQALEYAAENALELFVLGGGSNILVSDQGFDGLVIQVAIKGISLESEGKRQVVTAKAGEDWDPFVEFCVSKGLAGIECMSGIPGFVGGTPVQNVGAYGQEVSETIISVKCLDRTNRETLELTNEQCGFAYRTSIFNSSHRDRYIVLSVTFSLIPAGPPKIEYKDLMEYFSGREATLAATRETVLKIRAAKSMVILPADPNSRSAGSFFKNPVISLKRLSELEDRLDVKVPHFNASDGMVKVPAAWLIERAGFYKGFSLGNAGISTNHSLAIINRGEASAAEIVDLKNLIQETVRNEFGVDLMPEPIFVGNNQQ